MTTKWIRNYGRDTWHFHPGCQHYRRFIKFKHGITVDMRKPKSGELCNECLAKSRRQAQ